jgi:two-component system chemotaxis response regulator CheB
VVAASLGAGALEVLSKDALDLRDPDGADARAFRRRVKVLSGVRVIHHPRAVLNRHLQAPSREPLNGSVPTRRRTVIGICASAGGPPAVVSVLAQIPDTFEIPILVVQHIAAGFVEGFAHWLDDQVPLDVRMAAAGPVGPGIWVAPEGAHLKFAGDGRLELDKRSDAGPHRPSGDFLLRSIAAGAGPEGVAVVLTGMGRDGAEGLGEVTRAGGLTIAQDEASSVVFGMPKAAAEQGAELILGPVEIGQRLGLLRRSRQAS